MKIPKLRFHSTLSALAFARWSMAGLLLVATGASQAAPTVTASWAQKAPPGVMQSLAQGEPQALIVLFDDTAVQREAENMRRRLGVKTHTGPVQAMKAARYQSLKVRASNALPAGQHEMLIDYSHLPMAFMRFRSAAGLQAFLQRADVVAVYRDEKKYPILTQSLPLINQPPVVAAGNTGAGTTVEIIDTGVNYTLPTFGSCTSPGVPAGCRISFYQNTADSSTSLDSNGHGTQVSAIVAGVATATRIAMVNVFGTNPGASDFLIINAINFGIANQASQNIVAINMSLGDNSNNNLPCGNFGTNPYLSPVANANAAGIVVVAASGNNGYTAGISSPACTPGVVSVGATYDANLGSVNQGSCVDATTAADRVVCFSNSADYLTLLAPGAVVSTAVSSGSGTSFAAPFVAAQVAVIRSAFPTESLNQTIARMTGSGVPVTDARNGIVTPRINFLTALRPIPINNAFAQRTTLTGSNGTQSGYNVAATKESGEQNHAGNSGGASVWWRWVAPAAGQFSLNTQTSTFDTLLAVYTGSAVNGLMLVAANDDVSSSVLTSGVLFQAAAGVEYQIAVDGFDGDAGDITLNWNLNTTANANLSLTGTSTPSSVTQGDNIIYTLNVQNAGPQTATNVVLTDTLPAQTTFVSSSVACSLNGASLTCPLGTILSAGSISVAITVRTSTATSGSVSNIASLSSQVPDSNTANNSVTLATTVNPPSPVSNADTDVPTLPEWGAMLLASLLLGTAYWRRRSLHK